MARLGMITIGQYVPGQSLIHRLDPRTKFISLFIIMVAVFLAIEWFSYALLTAFIIGCIVLSRISFQFIWSGLKPVWFILAFTFIIHVWTNRTGDIVFSWGIFSIYEGGLVAGATMTYRLILLVLAASLLTLTTQPLVLTNGIEKLLHPLKKFKVPVHEFALMVAIALRFIPTLWQETDKLIKAQSSRGAQLLSGPLYKRLFHFIPIIIPLFLSAFQRAEDLALAMEARGYRGDAGRTQFRQLHFKRIDPIAIGVASLLLVTIVIYRFV